jgi:hypothetical protein
MIQPRTYDLKVDISHLDNVVLPLRGLRLIIALQSLIPN